MAVDERGMPLSVVVTVGNVNDCTAFPHVLARIWVPRPARASAVPAGSGDRRQGLKFAAIRRILRERGIAVTFPNAKAGRARRGPRGGRPPVFDPALHRRHNVVERCIGRLKQ
ncbi:hypothetical protein ACIBI3_35115 [Actinomadura luteofluorescens]|uniref:hypothetical protein n=1 Tax=Actinomadura luteofluorescens TaxID=46163 RepID=UPI0034899A8E